MKQEHRVREDPESPGFSRGEEVNTVSIYRNGTLTAATYSGENLEYAKKADSKKPVHMPNGRSGSLYGSADLKGVIRWTRAHLMNPRNREDLETYELKINAENIYSSVGKT